MTPELLKISSTVLVSVTALLTFLTYFLKKKHNREIEKLKKTIEKLKRQNYSLTPTIDPEWDRTVTKEARHLIQILGISYLGPLLHCREALIDFLKNRNGKLQVLLLDPESDAFKERTNFENDKVNRLEYEWQASKRILKDIVEKSGAKNNVEVRTHENKPDRALYIIDTDDESKELGTMLVNIYPTDRGTRGYVGGRFLASESLLRDRDSYKQNLEFYKAMWKDAKVLPL